ncbi:MAG: FAD-dependent oxidoreductase [Nitrospiraceae bacterium]
MTRPSSVLVLGAGPAGLAAAFRLSQQGHSVTLLEERDRLGGGLVASAEDQDLVDAIPPVIFGHQTATLQLLQDLGTLKHARLRTPGQIEFRTRDRTTRRMRNLWLPAPFHSILGLAASRGLTLRDLWRALVFLERTWEEDPGLPLDLDSRRADQWLTEIRQSEEAQVNVWAPLARFLLSSELSSASAGLLVEMLRRSFLTTRANSRVGIPDHDWSGLFIKPVADHYKKRQVILQTGARFDQIHVKGSRVAGVRLKDRRLLTADWYVAAIPPRRLSDLLPEGVVTHYATFHQLGKLADAVGLTVHLWLEAPSGTPRLALLVGHTFHWLVIRRTSGSNTEAVVSLVATGRADLMHHSDQALADFAWTDVRTALPEASQARLIKAQVIKRERACLMARPGSTAYRPVTESPFANLLLAGGWTDTGLPDSVEGAILSADRCAQTLSAKCSAGERNQRTA